MRYAVLADTTVSQDALALALSINWAKLKRERDASAFPSDGGKRGASKQGVRQSSLRTVRRGRKIDENRTEISEK